MSRDFLSSGPQQEISSPWDIEMVNLGNVPGCHGNLLVIAMAGTHQIWGYALTDIAIKHRGILTNCFELFNFPIFSSILIIHHRIHNIVNYSHVILLYNYSGFYNDNA